MRKLFLLIFLLSTLAGCSLLSKHETYDDLTQKEKIEYDLIKQEVDKIVKKTKSTSVFKMTRPSLSLNYGIEETGESL